MALIFIVVLLFITLLIEVKVKTFFSYLLKGVKNEFTTKQGLVSLIVVSIVAIFVSGPLLVIEGIKVVSIFFNLQQTDGHALPLYVGMGLIALTGIVNIIFVSIYDN